MGQPIIFREFADEGEDEGGVRRRGWANGEGHEAGF
jgi:hypothetical protein